ncbi:hypothetical protein ACIB24_05635 [Spongisporangium articulatum]|uniref:Glycosyltransferase RgtA/B/C/D-like domain-containing protein n=1 Tax=Spongisporangium articulatum TaxID=3362603 RepID=A0ABW8AJK6_9ACTN
MSAAPTVERPVPVTARGVRVVEPWGLVPVALLAAVSLWWVESADQSLFALAAEQLREGGVYYRDVWDIKQPGLYWFYLLGDHLVAGGLGARLLEAALAVVAAVLVQVLVAPWGLRRSVRLAAPTMVLGPYLLYASLSGVGEIEGLMNVLVLGLLACTWPVGRRAAPRPPWAWFVAGLLVAVVCLLKLLYAPVAVLLLGVALYAGRPLGRRAVVLRAAYAAGAFALVAVAVAALLAAQGVLGMALRTTFELPGQVAGVAALHEPQSLPELPRALKNMFPVLGPLAVLGLLTARRGGRLPLALALAGAGALELALGMTQIWTTYRWLMLSAPVGLLAVFGSEALLGWFDARPGRRTLALRLGVGLVAAGLTLPILRPAFALATAPDQRWGLDPASRIRRGEDAGALTRPVAASALVAGKVAPGERVYVFGDARIQVLTRTRLGLPVAGLTMHFMPPPVWDELARELAASPPRFVYVGARDWSYERRGPGRAVFDYLDEHYRVVAENAEGTWYETDSPGSSRPTASVRGLFGPTS